METCEWCGAWVNRRTTPGGMLVVLEPRPRPVAKTGDYISLANGHVAPAGENSLLTYRRHMCNAHKEQAS